MVHPDPELLLHAQFEAQAQLTPAAVALYQGDRSISYGELATRLGDRNAMRAVGLANGRNPIAIVVPCHRVIGADGSLTGFGGGLPAKRFLLELEGGLDSGAQRRLI